MSLKCTITDLNVSLFSHTVSKNYFAHLLASVRVSQANWMARRLADTHLVKSALFMRKCHLSDRSASPSARVFEESSIMSLRTQKTSSSLRKMRRSEAICSTIGLYLMFSFTRRSTLRIRLSASYPSRVSRLNFTCSSIGRSSSAQAPLKTIIRCDHVSLDGTP